MSAPGSLWWFARHEARLSWRDVFSVVGAERPGRVRGILIGVSIFLGVMHLIAHYVVGPLAGLALRGDLSTLVGVSAGLVLAGSAILSQAMESVTRTFYTRSDLELILSSPAQAQRLFAVRVGAIVLSVSAMSLLFVGPFINVLAWHGGVRWLAAYGVVPALAMVATAVAIILTVILFHGIGPRRTRVAAQIVAAIVGGLFAVGLQMAALFSTGTLSRLSYLGSQAVLAQVPDVDSLVWLPARAALGDGVALLVVFGASLALFVVTARVHVPRFAAYALAASGAPQRRDSERDVDRLFWWGSPPAALRRKEIQLILRDPWLLSQSLMQLLYLVPPAAMLWHSYAIEGGAPVVLVPVLVMAAGQLAGGLSWLAICGEDAPDLVLTAPVAPSRLLQSKLEAVGLCVTVVFVPFVTALLFFSVTAACIALLAIGASAASATAIQFWFRSQARRSQFRRRHTSSRVATLSEAFSSISWAAAAGIAVSGHAVSLVLVVVVLGFLVAVRRWSPARQLATV
jgi:ABC-2 type transport system permease protein